jgi:hypothetical protein
MPAPIVIHTKPFSFIRVNDDDNEMLLPAFGTHRAAFEFSVDPGSIGIIIPLYLKIKDEETGTITGFSTTCGAQIVETSGIYWKTGWVKALEDPITFAPGKVFRYVLENHLHQVVATTNPFIVVEEELYTSVLTYRCNTSGFEFFYSACDDTIVNQVRLPFYLLKPEHPKKRTVYRKSDGSNKLINSQVDKQYDLITEQSADLFHECMAIALSHEFITVENVNIREQTVQVLEAEDYKAGWPEEEDVDFAQGTAKLTVATFGYNTNNCETDDCGCVRIGFVTPPTLPDGVVGTPYSYSFDVNGTPPYGPIVDEGIPVWMTVSLSGATVTLSGTPTDSGAVTVGFSIENCGGDANFIDVNQTITIS